MRTEQTKTKAQLGYEQMQARIREELKELNEKLKTHKKQFSDEPHNFCFVGDLGQVENYLKEINSLLWN